MNQSSSVFSALIFLIIVIVMSGLGYYRGKHDRNQSSQTIKSHLEIIQQG